MFQQDKLPFVINTHIHLGNSPFSIPVLWLILPENYKT